MPKILIVDDSGYTRKMIIDSLAAVGYTNVVEASTGPEAIEKFRMSAPSLILLDLILTTEMDGLDVLREIRKISPSTKVVVLSAIGQEKYKNEALSLRVDGYLTKPFNPQELVQRVKLLIGK